MLSFTGSFTNHKGALDQGKMERNWNVHGGGCSGRPVSRVSRNLGKNGRLNPKKPVPPGELHMGGFLDAQSCPNSARSFSFIQAIVGFGKTLQVATHRVSKPEEHMTPYRPYVSYQIPGRLRYRNSIS